jgi:uncharacterized protein
MSNASLLDFPCRFPIKVIGADNAEFSDVVLRIIDKHLVDPQQKHVHQRSSSNQSYLSLTITIEASSQAQLDAIYHDLSQHQAVLMAL